MNTIHHNPYRIIGILANASAKEIQSRKAKVSAFARVGKEITSEYDFPFLSSLERSSTIIDKAFSDIEQNQNKVAHSLFWFINLNPIDNTAIQHLISGNKEKAIEIWGKLTIDKDVNSKNFSAFNNIGTLYLLGQSNEEIKQGIEAKIKLIESDNFKDFVHTVADETFTIDQNKQVEILIDTLLVQFKDKFSISETMDLFGNCNGITQKYLSQKFTEEPIHKIETQIEKTRSERIKNKAKAFKYGKGLYQNAKPELHLLKSILGINNLQYKMLADNVAKELLQCSIDYFNESQKQGKSNDYLEDSLKISKWAGSIAASEVTKSKVSEDINTLEAMKGRELLEAIAVLKSIKDAYEKACREIDKQVDELQYMTIGGFGEMKSTKIPNLHGSSINWSKVSEMKRNALNWNKVVEMIKETIPLQNVEKIKNSEQHTKVNEYKSLVNFIYNKLEYFQKAQVKYLCYWETASSSTSYIKKEEKWIETKKGCTTTLILFGAVLLGGVYFAWGWEGMFIVGIIIFAFIFPKKRYM